MKSNPTGDVPLVVDLDGTLVLTDLLLETFIACLVASPSKALHCLSALSRGKAAFKAALVDLATISTENLPYNRRVLDLLWRERNKGRSIYLASASDERLVQAVARHVGCFEGYFATRHAVNLAGVSKAETLVETFGRRGFDYAGNAYPDLAVWKEARGAIIVNPAPRLLRKATREGNVSEVIHDARNVYAYVKLLRPHQWLKNLLVFLPVVTAHQIIFDNIMPAVLAFVSFSVCASSTYILNDIVDVENDRKHHSKKYRPIASGQVPILHAFGIAALLVVFGVIAAAFLPLFFAVMLAFYMLVTVAYSLRLKGVLLVDVIVLGGLYTVRVVAGGQATGIEISPWLLAFSMLLFFALAIVKRHTELVKTEKAVGKLPGRSYEAEDMPVLLSFATASGYGAVIVLGLYISSPVVMELYSTPKLLWLVCAVLLYWISRILILSHRGELHDDPVVFAATDRISWLVAVCVAVLVLLSA